MLKNLTIRHATQKDVLEINFIHNEAIRNTASNWAWSERSEEDALKWLTEHDEKKYPVLVAEAEGKVVGYSSLSKFRGKEGYWPTAENSLYIHCDYRGEGIGTMLLERLLEEAQKSDLEVICSWIDSENKQSIKLHEKYGFYIVGEMKNIGEKFGEKRSCTILQLDIKR